jgi:kinesin family protein 18/19
VRPFTANEQLHVRNVSTEPLFLGDGSFAASSDTPGPRHGGKSIRKIINVVDDKMLIFDPPENNPMVKMQQALFPGSGSRPPSAASRIREHRFVFDRLFDEDASQTDVYNHTTRPLLDNVFDGYNATVFAYGATGCGKTHTISGTPESPGIIFLTMKELFERIDDAQDTKIIDLSLSYLEIYNETIRDLLETNPSGGRKQLVLRENADRRISVSNLSSHKPENVEQVMDMILQGNQNRTMSPTEANAVSSRSHAVLQINITQKARTAELSEAHTFATLSVIDLAGSERASATKNKGERLMEGANINKSLLALGNCINALCDPRQRGHVPYRDSKLTRLLKFSLGGNCKTVMIVCVSPSSQHYDETLNTLKYADRAKRIKTKVTRNEHNLDRHVGSYLKMITEQRAEIEQLRARESSAIEMALSKEAKARQTCHDALTEAFASLDLSIDKSKQTRIQQVKCLARLRAVTAQIAQLDVLNDALATTLPVESLLNGVGQLKAKLVQEQKSLVEYTRTSDHYGTSISQLVNRLEQIPGWTKEFAEYFQLYANWKQTATEHQLLQQVVDEVPNMTETIKFLSELLFSSVAKLDGLRQCDPAIVQGEIQLLVQQLSQTIEKALLDPETLHPMVTAVDVASILREASVNETPVLHISPARSPVRPINRSSSSRRVSILKKRSPYLHALKRNSIIVRSPSRPVRKSSKRVRWEDDEPQTSDVFQDKDDLSGLDLKTIKDNRLSPLLENADEVDGSIMETDTSISSISESRKPHTQFGVRGDLSLRASKKRPSVLGISRKLGPTRVEKESSSSPTTMENLDQGLLLNRQDDEQSSSTIITPRKSATFHLAQTASTAMKRRS